MITKKRITDIKDSAVLSVQDLLTRGKSAIQIDHKQELFEIQNQIQDLAPNTQV